MLDYRGIEALYTVQQLQSFEAAAKKLHITQSAISQRLKGLESFYGEPLLVRTLPYRPTELGKQLIGHFKRISHLEMDLEKQMGVGSAMPRISIALNRDSLETWFLDFVNKTEVFRDIILEITSDDQELTLGHFKDGLVSACLSTSGKEVLGGKVHFLGNMEYLLVASPSFKKRYFSENTLEESLQSAPSIKFDKDDKLHERYLEKFFDLDGKDLNYHIIPSVRGFKQFVVSGYGYALIPKMDIVEELKKKKLVQLTMGKVWQIPLYWHYWAIESKSYQRFNGEVISKLQDWIY